MARRLTTATILCSVLALLGACVCPTAKGPAAGRPPAVRDAEIADVLRLPQEITPYADAAGERLAIGDSCRATLLGEFRVRFFAPWTRTVPFCDPVEEKNLMTKVARANWYGENRRIVARKLLQEILDNCALETFPARNEAAIAVAPSHLRGLPTRLPLFGAPDDYPFDMLQYPNVKLNEPLRILHASRDGIWLYVETSYTCGWMEARDLALADPGFVTARMKLPHLVIVRDYTAVNDGKGGTSYGAKIGTILPLVAAGEGWWEVEVAAAGEGRKAVGNVARIPRAVAALHPLAFNRENVALIGNQLTGQPYGWGEMYGLRDCSAMLRDFFMPFGIWMPRTAVDQIASIRQRLDLSGFTPREKEEAIGRQGLPFLSLFFKPGHIMLYIGTDPEGRPLVFHNAWSIRVKDAAGAGLHHIGRAVITTLEPGKELGLVEGGSLLEQGTALATITGRCAAAPGAVK
ncbi:NLP/P60 protein [Geotalea uraniireducens Rf4]|uniref:NLP/P60 protein n=1 Tax=Geotalea uraniireducens (strain Rf4) TaxID=351605 RepID=A5GA07_GEOUR|nr:NLP/P60 protein [Geotalea uraniireducens Rf4]